MRPTIPPRVLAAVLLAGCAAPSPTDNNTPPPPTLASVELTPVAATIGVGDSVIFQVVGHMSDGSTSAVTVDWSVAGGTLSGDVYHAGNVAGAYKVIASAASGALADTANITISAAPPPVTLTSITVTPAQDTLLPAGTRTFAAQGHYSNGATDTASVTWSATGGTITQAGLYTAGNTTGNFRVIATGKAAAVADTSPVVIKAAPVTLTGVVVTPALDTLIPGGTRTFAATGQYSDGSTGSVAVTWSATGGTISTGGVYTAGSTLGTFRVIGRNAAANKADTSTVVIKAGPAPTLTAVVVNPPTATVNPGATQAFSVAGSYSDGSTGPVSVTWTATGGTISTSGLYTAGSTPGAYRVIATATTAAKADTSAVTIPDTTSPGTGTVLLTENFEDNNAGARGWYANTSPPISTTEHHSGVGSLVQHWPVNATTPDNGVSLRHLFTATDKLYVRYWIKYSSNFVGSGKAYHPHEITLLTDADGQWTGPSETHLTGYIEMNWQNGGGIARLATTDVSNIDQTKIGVDLTNVTENRSVSGCNGNSDNYTTGCYLFGSIYYNEKVWLSSQPVLNSTAGPIYKNDWHKVEVYYQMNTIVGGKGQNNGVAQYWLDGQLKIDLHNILFRTGANPNQKWNQILLAYYIGDGSPADQSLWVDDLVVATGPVP